MDLCNYSDLLMATRTIFIGMFWIFEESLAYCGLCGLTF